jgi:hypothetical protein
MALYFAGLEALRALLHRSLIQVAAIADVAGDCGSHALRPCLGTRSLHAAGSA